MENPSSTDILKRYGIDSREAFAAEAFSRNIGIFNAAEQEELAAATIAIPGMGGVGGLHLITLARTGIGKFKVADFDIFEAANINRQYGARIPDLGRGKLDVMIEEALRVNPFLEIERYQDGVTADNLDDFLAGVSVVLDGLDFFNFDTRRMLFKRAREKGIHVVTAGPMGFSSAMLVFSPHEGMGFDEYFDIRDGMAPEEQYLHFAAGLAPRATHFKYMDLSRINLREKAGPSLGIGCLSCAAMAATEAVRIILKRSTVKPVPFFSQFDPYAGKLQTGRLHLGLRNPVIRAKIRLLSHMLRKDKGYRRPEPPLPQDNPASADVSKEVMIYIIQAGIQAPSGDNAQPWKFSHDGNSISLYLDQGADTSFFNVNQIASFISCGAVIENMHLAAGRFGLDTKIHLQPIKEDSSPLARMELVRAQRRADPLGNFIWSRQTNRTLYQQRPLPSSTIDNLHGSIEDLEGVSLHLLADRQDIRRAARLVFLVDRIRTENRSLHEHLMKMIRFDQREAEEKRDGLPLKNLEAGIMGEAFLKATRSWRAMNAANKLFLGRFVALHSYLSILHSGAIGLITTEGHENEHFLRGGRAVERIWLLLTQKGLAMQPMTAITLFRMREILEEGQSFGEKHRSLLRSAWREYRSLFPAVDFQKNGHIMLFRCGFGKTVRFGTYRKEVDHFLTKNHAPI